MGSATDHISNRAQAIRPFVVMDVVARAKELAAVGHDVVRLEIGDPDLPTPAVITRAAEDAMQQGDTGYTQSAGLPTLREAVSAHYLAAYGTPVDPANIVVTQGTSPAMLLVFGALLDPGDEVIVSDPCYPAYPNYVNFLGGVPVPVRVHAEEGFRFRPEEVRAAITPKTRAIMVNSPCNPTGTVLPAEDLEELASIAEAHGIWIVSDEIYHGLDFSGPSRSILEFTDRAFVLNGFSKVYAMTGWRLGYLIAPQLFVRPCEKIQQNFFLCANHFVQVAGTVALTQAQGEVLRMREIYDERRRYLVPALQRIGLTVASEPTGAFYVFADARAWGPDSLDLSRRLLEDAYVSVAPGIDFGPGGEGFLRLSYATSLERLAEGVSRLEAWAETAAGS
ncbi:MAG: pyridoxal phosphate-dependent aminotransferase [Coriobacteriia bacterium]|jgi:aspartate/methionine/tyrosine aminotransferase|nr:pyridoxal phosphate-dependent aminotransferase [Coriobacteriia bacterium]